MRGVLLLVVAAAVPGAARGETVEDVIARNLEARGGLARIEAVATLRMTGRMSVGPGEEVPVTIEKKRPGRIRFEMVVKGRPAVQAYDGRTAWGIPALGSRMPREMPAEAIPLLASQADIDGPLVDYRAKGHQVALVGREKVDGTDCWELRVKLASGGVEDYFLAVRSGLIIKIEGTQKVQGREIKGETLLGDYRSAGGVLWPHTVRSGALDQPDKQVLTVDRVEVNVPMDDARFRMPATGAE
jgi:hypothetical protein